MYKLVKIINDIVGPINFIEGFLVCVGFKKSSVKAIDVNSLEIKWQADYEGGLSRVHKNEIFAPNMTFYNTKGDIIFSNPLDVPLNYLMKNEKISVWMHSIDWKKK